MTHERPHTLVKASEVVGVAVKNSRDEDLGKIEEIILDKVTGYTEYVVLSFGGILGMGDKYFALPWEILKYSAESECFLVDVDKETLKKAPGFDKSKWPSMADIFWEKDIKTYYSEFHVM